MWGSFRKLAHDPNGAVAATVALSLFALIAVGGIAFDYARLASMDSELQSAADQAAIAAASQLDGQSGAIVRATAAAQNLVANSTLLASGASRAITVPTITFCSAFNDSVASTASACTTTTSDSAARIVWVQVGGRTADYALTPIVGAISSGTVGGEAVAGMNSAICKEPPVMMCNPNPNPANFNVNDFIGKGMRLIAKGSGASYAPGDFGFLDVGAGASDLSKLMGWGSPPDECVDITQPSTEPGAMTSVINEFNTRFDLYESGDSIGCFGSSKCPPSLNSRKDVVINHGSPYTKTNCGFVGTSGNGWITTEKTANGAYRPTTSNVNSYTATPDAMGYPRDRCHAIDSTGNCIPSNSRIGDGNWDIDVYWRVNHPAGTTNGAVDDGTGKFVYPTSLNSTIMAAAPLPAGVTRSYPTRYQVYKWEMANAATQLPSRTITGVGTDYGQPVCLPGLTGSTPGPTTADRRVLPVAVVNCTGLAGAKPVNPIDWIDAFLVEPSISRDNGLSGGSKVTYTNVGDIYVEVIGRTSTGTGGTTNQFVRHDRPYLIR